MSEMLTWGFDVHSIPGMTESIGDLSTKYGIEPTDAEQGVKLAMSMHNILLDYKTAKPMRGARAVEKEVKGLFTQAAHNTPEIPIDSLGRPLPRYRYVAYDMLGTVLEEGDAFYDYFSAVKDAPMVPNFKKTKEVIDTLVPLLEQNEFPYNQDRFMLPEDPEHMPKIPFKDPQEEANFYLTACLWMRRTDSNKAMRDLGEAFDNTREFERDPFDPEIIATMTPQEVADIFGKYPQLRMMNNNAPGLIHNMRFLNARFDGDIRNVAAGTGDFDEMMLRLKNSPHQADPSLYIPEFGDGMYGFQDKMGSMLVYYLSEAGLIPPIDYPPPIDQHLAKLTTGTGCVAVAHEFRNENYMTDYLQKIVRDLYYDISITHRISTNAIAKALWLLGSKNCSQSPATFTKVITRDARKSVFEEYEPDYSRVGFDTLRIYATCLGCPLHISDQCTHVSRGKENHLKGIMTARDRSELPNPGDYSLFGRDPEWEALTATSAAAARNKADIMRRTVHRPAYEKAQSDTVEQEDTSTDQDTLFDDEA